MAPEVDDGGWNLRCGKVARARDRWPTAVALTASFALLASMATAGPQSFYWNRGHWAWGMPNQAGLSLCVLLALLAAALPLSTGDPGWSRGYFSDAYFGAALLLAGVLALGLGPTMVPGVMALFPFRNRWNASDLNLSTLVALRVLVLAVLLIAASPGLYTLPALLAWTVASRAALVTCGVFLIRFWVWGEPE